MVMCENKRFKSDAKVRYEDNAKQLTWVFSNTPNN